MAKVKTLFIGLLTTITANLGYAGAVSGGGGGTTIPDPAYTDWIAGIASDDAGFILKTWLHHEEYLYRMSGISEQQASPFYKIFGAGGNIYQVIEQTPIELRMSEPCYDAEGNPKDGSIFGSTEGSICISPFTMAPKLSQRDMGAETVALIFHELSHLMGADEAEAEALQMQAIYALDKVRFIDVHVKVSVMANTATGGRVQDLITFLDLHIMGPSTAQTSDIELFSERLLNFRTELGGLLEGTLILDEHTYRVLTPHFTKLSAIRDYLGANDPQISGDHRQWYTEQLDKGFGGKDTVTAGEYSFGQDGSSFDSFPEYNEVLLTRIADEAGLVSELIGVRTYLEYVQAEVRALNDFRMTVYRN